MTVTPGSGADSGFDVGRRLRLLREVLGLSQREVARRAAMTNANLSLIEQGKVSPSLASLERLLGAFPMSLSEFFSDLPLVKQVVVKESELERWTHNQCQMSGINTELSAREGLSLARIILQPRQELQLDWKVSNGLVKGLVLQGAVDLHLDQQTWHLKVGDAFRFFAHRKHFLCNPGMELTELVVVAIQKAT